ncbi:hypothetical protein BDZ91DRAFT_272688 [Kalaharituber pfeilii]|nr:hypothetical protein BDZ91DRAFT_272688 [Kalaharituber pfeilii]
MALFGFPNGLIPVRLSHHFGSFPHSAYIQFLLQFFFLYFAFRLGGCCHATNEGAYFGYLLSIHGIFCLCFSYFYCLVHRLHCLMLL